MFRKRYIWMLALALLVALLPTAWAEAAEDRIVLLEGSSGTPVKIFQNELKVLGYLDAEPDGVYGGATALAATAYATDRGLPVTAGVSLTMIKALRGDLNISKLDVGARSIVVYAVQQVLYGMGFLSDTPDGVYGANTRQAVKDYMDYASPSAVEYMQARQDALISEAEAATTTFGDMEYPAAVDMPLISVDTIITDGVLTGDWIDFILDTKDIYGPTVSVGDKGSAAKRVQKRLNALGYLAAGMDGAFGENSAMALRYFQHRNNLPETGNCDADTQKVLFSENALESDQYVAPYAAYVSTSESRVRIYKWSGAGYTSLVKEFKCSCGAKSTPTIKGTFQAVGQISEWYYMPTSHVWVQYAFQIQGNYFFHSVLFSAKGSTHPSSSSVRNLGRNVSHGCIRLAVEDCKWIYDNCTRGMTVIIQ